MTIQFDSTYSYLDTGKGRKDYPMNYIPNLMAYCKQIVPFMNFYKKQIASYNYTAFESFRNEIGLILPTFTRDKRHKRDITTSLVSDFIGLAYDGISSFLHYKCQYYFMQSSDSYGKQGTFAA